MVSIFGEYDEWHAPGDREHLTQRRCRNWSFAAIFILLAGTTLLYYTKKDLLYSAHEVERNSMVGPIAASFQRNQPSSSSHSGDDGDNMTQKRLTLAQQWPSDPTDPESFSEDRSGEEFTDVGYMGDDNDAAICAGWCLDQYLDRVDCERHGLTRLKTAFQIENCEAALNPTQAPVVGDKIEKLIDSTVFTFFRGAAAYFDYNMMCADPNFSSKLENMPKVYSNGDCHPENFGVMVQSSNNGAHSNTTGDLVWGVNDFDQSFLTPFSWDLKRGAVGFALAVHDRGWAVSDVASVSWTFIESYIETIMLRDGCHFKNSERFVEGGEFIKKSKIIRDLFEKARERDSPSNTANWLKEKMSVDTKKNRFVLNKERGIYPLNDSFLPKFQESIDAWLYHGVAALAKYPNLGDFYKVVSVAEKFGSGTGSVGLKRYWLLLKGRYNEPHGRIVLELKQSVKSVLEVFFHYSFTSSQEGKRSVDAVRSAWPYTNLFYGWTTLDDQAYIVRERSKHHIRVNIEDLTKEEYLEYANQAGRALAFYHVRARCPNYKCPLDAQSAVDEEICAKIQDHLKDVGVESFKKYIYTFTSSEYVRQNDAFDLLYKFLRYRQKVNDKGADWRLDVLIGPEPLGEACNRSQ